MSHYHFIAIGGAVMHQLALHLRNEGHTISGSDDAIFDPAKSNLIKYGLLPEAEGWFPDKITNEIDAVILGMHAKADNPELVRAQELGLKIFSFPEFVFEQSKHKTRVAVAGSHGKTSITSMIMHVLITQHKNFDYLVGAQLAGFDFMVKTSNDADVIILEADEYLTSPLDLRSKFLHYHPHIAIISGIAWDHINVFPTFEEYLETFRKFIRSIQPEGYLIYNAHDEELIKMVEELKPNIHLIPYSPFEFKTENDESILVYNGRDFEVNVFGSHNFSNLKSAFEVCRILGIDETKILESFQTFNGAAKRLEKVNEDNAIRYTVFRDFAHAPSKVKATVNAVRERYTARKITAVFELHTYSSLQDNFIEQYAHSLDAADIKILFLDEHALKIKNKQDMDSYWLKQQFADETIVVMRSKEELQHFIDQSTKDNSVLLLMSSGNLGGLDWKNL